MARRRNRTRSARPDFAAAYRAAGRTREAEIAERTGSASLVPEEPSLLTPELLEVCRQLKVVQDRARSLGMFVEDRDLLTCGACGLEEDVLVSGELVTRQAGHALGVPSTPQVPPKSHPKSWQRCRVVKKGSRAGNCRSMGRLSRASDDQPRLIETISAILGTRPRGA